jgi:hypothetical protein
MNTTKSPAAAAAATDAAAADAAEAKATEERVARAAAEAHAKEEAKAAKAAVLAAVKEAKTSTKQQRSDKFKSLRTEEKQSDRATRQAELAGRADADEARKRGAGFSPLQVSRAKEMADAAELRAARRAAAQAAKDKKAALEAGEAGAAEDAADSDADDISIEDILAAATADAEAEAAGVVVTTKKRILEAAPELLLDKADAAPIMKRWYTVTVRAAMPCFASGVSA